MNIVKILIVLAVAGLAYQFWYRPQTKSKAETPVVSAAASRSGFVSVPTPSNAGRREILIVAAEDCPEEGARRADDLAQQLSRRKIPYTRTHNVSFSFSEPDPGALDRVRAVMGGDVPIVLFNGKGKANPSFDEVVSEYDAAR